MFELRLFLKEKTSNFSVLFLNYVPTDVFAYWCTLNSPSSTLFSQINVSLIALSFHPNL